MSSTDNLSPEHETKGATKIPAFETKTNANCSGMERLPAKPTAFEAHPSHRRCSLSDFRNSSPHRKRGETSTETIGFGQQQ
ncbi:hypothetical protein H4219_004751, partial [Mycoemilia scoparia]